MDPRFGPIAASAAANHGVVAREALTSLGLARSTVHRWVAGGLLLRIGPRSLAVAGAPATWERSLASALVEVGPAAAFGGRSDARLLGLDGFDADADAVEVLMPRVGRRTRIPGVTVHSTTEPIPRSDLQRVDGLACLRAERLILDAARFGLTRTEIESAIDSAVRLRLVSERRLRDRALARHTPAVPGSRVLLDALVDAGGESGLERAFLRIVRRAGLDRPATQVVHAAGDQVQARVDFLFAADLVVEVAGHGPHATRRQRQRDAERHTDLTLAGRRVLTFSNEDVFERPGWVLSRLAQARNRAA